MSETYNVYCEQSGELVVRGVDLEQARSNAARLNAEARAINPETGRATSMHRGEVCTFAVWPSSEPLEPWLEWVPEVFGSAEINRNVRMLGSSEDTAKIIEEEKKPIDWDDWPTHGDHG